MGFHKYKSADFYGVLLAQILSKEYAWGRFTQANSGFSPRNYSDFFFGRRMSGTFSVLRH